VIVVGEVRANARCGAVTFPGFRMQATFNYLGLWLSVVTS
jgi:hypothetical protein